MKAENDDGKIPFACECNSGCYAQFPMTRKEYTEASQQGWVRAADCPDKGHGYKELFRNDVYKIVTDDDWAPGL